MVIDTSILVAILFDEPERLQASQAIARDPKRLVSAASLLEASIVAEARQGEAAGRDLDLALHRMHATIVAVDETQAELARSAWRRFGKGNHPARLDYGDCFSYALAVSAGEPLLFKGDDFGKTDIAVVSY